MFPQSLYRHPVRIVGAAAALFLAVMTAWLSLIGLSVYKTLSPAEIAATSGFSYSLDLAPVGPYWVHIPGDTLVAPDRSSLRLYEDGVPLGPAHAIHNDIAISGAGRYSLWSGSGLLIFSASDNSDPRSNGRKYSIEGRATLASGWLVFSGLSLFLAILLGRPWLRWLSASWLAPLRVAGIMLLSTMVAVVVLLLGVELVFRMTTPFDLKVWPARHVPGVGFLFEPGAEVRDTNHLDYWQISRANSLGFLDREPHNEPGEGCHIAIIGDSFVEASHVSLEQRLQSRLEALAAERHPDWRLTASAFGYSGTGQLNQLPFYDRFARSQQPDIVVLVAVSNDFANNSTVLEAVRNGWHPEYPPRLFARRETTGDFSFISVATDWRDHLLPSEPYTEPEACALCDFSRRLEGSSVFYRWLKLKLQVLGWGWWGQAQQADVLMLRKKWLENHVKPLASGLSAWSGRPGMDAMFREPTLPPTFDEAVALTGFGLDQFHARTTRDDAALVVLATTSMNGRDLDRFRALTEARAIPLLDQNDWLRQTGEEDRDLHFRHDGHWNARGHEVAAEMLLEFLEHGPQACP